MKYTLNALQEDNSYVEIASLWKDAKLSDDEIDAWIDGEVQAGEFLYEQLFVLPDHPAKQDRDTVVVHIRYSDKNRIQRDPSERF